MYCIYISKHTNVYPSFKLVYVIRNNCTFGMYKQYRRYRLLVKVRDLSKKELITIEKPCYANYTNKMCKNTNSKYQRLTTIIVFTLI